MSPAQALLGAQAVLQGVPITDLMGRLGWTSARVMTTRRAVESLLNLAD
jgi:hypothetical protein